MPIETRTLKEFYPNFQARQNIHYTFAYSFLTPYVHKNPKAFFTYLLAPEMMGVDNFIQSRWSLMEARMGLAPSVEKLKSRRWIADLQIWIEELDGHPVAVIQMPTPEQEPNAYFVIVALQADGLDPKSWPETAKARVLILERDATGSQRGYLQEWFADGRHQLLHSSVPTTVKDALTFIRASKTTQ